MRRNSLAAVAICIFLFSGKYAHAADESPVWYDEGGYTKAGKRALRLLSTSNEHGISPDRYELEYLFALEQGENADRVNEKITQSVILYLLDLKYGILGDKNIVTNEEGKTAEERKKYFAEVLDGIATRINHERIIKKYVDEGDEYWELKKGLNHFQNLSLESADEEIQLSSSIKLNEQSEHIPLIRKKLALTESYNNPESLEKISQSIVYDEDLQTRIIEFQKTVGLKPDGVIGKRTAAKLNNILDMSITQISFSMDKIRADDSAYKTKQVVVNIPAFELTAFENGKKKFSMPVIVGKRARKTPEFDNYIDRVVFNPEWYPTARIMREDLLPKFRKNPNYKANGGYKVMWKDSGEQVAGDVDWNAIDSSDIRIVQSKGNGNALGVVKFLLPDNDSVYLHDTNKKKLFEKSYRALSSGCIRLSDPLKFAEFVFDGNEVDGKSFDDIIKSRSQKHIKTEQVAVKTIYQTAWIDDNGKLQVRDDVYGKYKSFKIAMSKKSNKLISSISPAPASDRASVKVDKLASTVLTSSTKL